jgi:hypothetical protein
VVGDELRMNPNKISDLGEHMVTLTLTDGKMNSSECIFKVSVYNSAPTFTRRQPSDIIVPLGETRLSIFPPYSDPEGSVVTLSLDL